MTNDTKILQELAKHVREIAEKPIQQTRREKWTKHHNFKGSEPLIYIRAFAFDELCGKNDLACVDPFFRQYEKQLRAAIYRDTFEDDFIIDPWITLNATYTPPAEFRWGVRSELGEKMSETGAAAFSPVIQNDEDFIKLKKPVHCIDEEKTLIDLEKLSGAIGDILTVNLNRGPMLFMWTGDISTDLAKLRGLEQIMWDAYDNPQFLHKLAAFMSQSILDVHHQAEKKGDWGRSNNENQCLAYAEETLPPQANTYGVKRSSLWGYAAAQEFTGFSGEMFDEFMLRYQIPILEQFGLCAYGCCEDLTNKITYLKKIKNLRRIAVSPFANVQKCAEQIGSDYIVSYRPNPAIVSYGLNEDALRKEYRTQFAHLKENRCTFDVTLKDVETVSRDPNVIARFVCVTREEIEKIR